jgi:alanyl-tRNA synthetase
MNKMPLNSKEIKREYLKYMSEKGWAYKAAERLVNSTFPHSFVISGALNWANGKLQEDPFSKEIFMTCQRCFRHFDEPAPPRLPFFHMLLTVSWDYYSREKIIEDNFKFLTEILKLDPNKIKITYWKGGNVYGLQVNPEADVYQSCVGSEFEKMRKDGFYIPMDEEAVNAWKNCGIKNEQLIATGEIDPAGLETIILNAREPLAGVRSELFYEIEKGHLLEVGIFVYEGYIKKPIALRYNVKPEAFENPLDLKSEKFLLKLKPKFVAGGLGLERVTMIMNGVNNIFQIEPMKSLRKILMSNAKDVNYNELVAQTEEINKKRGSLYRKNLLELAKKNTKENIINNAIAYLMALPWLINDGANELPLKKEKQRVGIYRKVLRTIIADLEIIGCDKEEIYKEFFDKVIDFYSDDIEPLKISSKECIKEIEKQKERERAA